MHLTKHWIIPNPQKNYLEFKSSSNTNPQKVAKIWEKWKMKLWNKKKSIDIICTMEVENQSSSLKNEERSFDQLKMT